MRYLLDLLSGHICWLGHIEIVADNARHATTEIMVPPVYKLDNLHTYVPVRASHRAVSRLLPAEVRAACPNL